MRHARGEALSRPSIEAAMTATAQATPTPTETSAADLLALSARALGQARAYRDAVLAACRAAVAAGAARADDAEAEQRALHGYAWVASYVESLAQLHDWATRLHARGALGGLAADYLAIGFAEYLQQLRGGLPMSQCEILRPLDFGLRGAQLAMLDDPDVIRLIETGNTPARRASVVTQAAAGRWPDPLLDNDAISAFQEQVRRFSDERIAPFANDWHRQDILIPDDVVRQMGELGIFGLTIGEQWGGSDMGKLAMTVVSEELSRGYIGTGSLGTRSEIAGELISTGGTPQQQERYLRGLAEGSILPTAVFTEPGSGSDLASLKTRAVRDGEVWRVIGAKTWITHASRSDLMTMLVRTEADVPGARGISLLLADKPRGEPGNPFPAPGMRGSEIQVLGYRGMKEYELAFDGFTVPASALLGGVPGQGFRQLMATFESARIQTAARAIGVGQNALELALAYAQERRQFGRPIIEFPRVRDKLAMMAVETMLARQLTYFAARRKDTGKRCDVEAGMAKLVAARVAWSNADNALQVHGGNGYALEYPVSRLLCDARILNIFEGAGEIQAHIIARGLI
jgi:(2S)-methylsuccinyl-CoA dehydrogenase